MTRNFLHIVLTTLFLLSVQVFQSQAQDTSLSPSLSHNSDSVKVNNIFIIGNEKTQKNVILRELDFTTDFYYNWKVLLDIIEADRKKIYNLRLFTSVEITPLITAPDEVEILISVKERWYVVPSLIFQLADRNFSEWWTNQNKDLSRVNFGMRLSHGNVGGRNEKFRFSGQLGFTRAIDFLYSKPYIDKKQKHGLAAQFTFYENKTIPLKSADNRQIFYTNENEDILKKNLSTALRYTFRRTFYNFHFFTVGYNHTWISPDVLQQNPEYFHHNDSYLKYMFLSYSFRHDKRDNNSYTTDGELLQLTATKYGLFSTENLNEVELNLTANRYLKFNDKFHFSTGLTANWFLSSSQPYTLVRGIGYNPNFIRGYELNVIEGQQLYVHKNSFRWKFINWEFDISNAIPLEQFNTIPLRLYLSANFDHGYVKDRNFIPENALLTNRYLYGYGLGIDMVWIYDAVFRFEYSFNNSGGANFFFNIKAPF